MKRFLKHIIKLLVVPVSLYAIFYGLNQSGISDFIESSKEFKILFNPKHKQTIIDLKLNQEKKDISIIGTSRTAGFENDMFSNESFYNYSMVVNSVIDIKNLIIELKLNKGDTVVVGLDQWNFNESSPVRLSNNFKNNKLNIPYYFMEKKKIINSHFLIGENSIENFSGFRNDGSFFYGKRHIVDEQELKDYNFIDTYSRIRDGNRRFEYGSKVDLKQIKVLQELLVYAQNNEITLMGFFPPFAPSVNSMMNNPKYNYSYIDNSSKLITTLFDNYGFTFKDLTKIDLYDDSFYLDGFHCNRNVYYYIIQTLGVSVNSDFENEFKISNQEKITLNNYFSDKTLK